MVLRVRDSLSGDTHEVRPEAGRPLALYVCGPTVYDLTHVGHARTYLYFDVIRRLLGERGVPVRHVLNITDVEDKISHRADALGLAWKDLARQEERAFWRDLAGLGVLRPHLRPRASDFVPRMIEVARALDRHGRVRRGEEGWMYFPEDAHDPRNFSVGSELEDHAVPEPGHPFGPSGEIPREFLVWKRQEPPLPSWPSPWGRGVPGWHLECYTMARDLVAVPLDLHGGGVDLVYPHHYAGNEIALTLDHTPFARTFVHTGFVLEGGRKMSKSIGNLVPLRSALADHGRDALRWYLLAPPFYRPLRWSAEALAAASDEREEIARRFRFALAPGAGGSVDPRAFTALADGVLEDLEDGFRTAEAFDRLRAFSAELAGRANPRVARGGGPAARRAIARIERVLGIRLAGPTGPAGRGSG